MKNIKAVVIRLHNSPTPVIVENTGAGLQVVRTADGYLSILELLEDGEKFLRREVAPSEWITWEVIT